MGLFDPSWVKKIPKNLRPDDYKIQELESLRKQYGASDQLFAALVMQSPGITKMIFEQEFVEFKKKNPYSTNKQVFEAIIQLRYFTAQIEHGMSPDASRELLQSPLCQASVKLALEKTETLEDVTYHLVEHYEQFWTNTPDPLGINTRIAEILGYHRPVPMADVEPARTVDSAQDIHSGFFAFWQQSYSALECQIIDTTRTPYPLLLVECARAMKIAGDYLSIRDYKNARRYIKQIEKATQEWLGAQKILSQKKIDIPEDWKAKYAGFALVSERLLSLLPK